MSLAVMLWLSGVVVIYLGRCGYARGSLFVDHICVDVLLNFGGLSQLRNYFNSKIFPISTVGLHSA